MRLLHTEPLDGDFLLLFLVALSCGPVARHRWMELHRVAPGRRSAILQLFAMALRFV
jgi:hypothetical protein